MKHVLVATAVLVLSSAPAFASDLTVYEAPAPITAPDLSEELWGGFHVGIHGGYGWAGDFSGVDIGSPGDPDDDRFFESDAEGPVFGAQAGFDWQWDWILLGAEADASWTGINVDEDDGKGVFEEGDVVDFLASARVRAGVGFDALLAYATAGVGFAGLSDPFDEGDGDIEAGWVAGAGGDILLTDNLSFGLQYLHYGLGDDDRSHRDGVDSFDGSIDTFTGRFNLRLGR